MNIIESFQLRGKVESVRVGDDNLSLLTRIGSSTRRRYSYRCSASAAAIRPAMIRLNSGQGISCAAIFNPLHRGIIPIN